MKSIPGYPNYLVDESGFIWSNHLRAKMTPCTNSDGYQRVYLYNSDGRQWFFVHRLVAQAFIPNPSGKPEVNHKDWTRWNNTVDNLEWVTSSENKRHARKRKFVPVWKTKEEAGTPF